MARSPADRKLSLSDCPDSERVTSVQKSSNRAISAEFIGLSRTWALNPVLLGRLSPNLGHSTYLSSFVNKVDRIKLALLA
ncbi:hypothetical protein [Microcoleus sp. CAWBG58]|uniref:hypothetical protein n=1 Tax=Microcoleus sp. CAWBG58 TaxID=2841651 RepID=UPI0025DDAD6B|nr:hypothetical protein [Microcoleus sp. CAWBG58]